MKKKLLSITITLCLSVILTQGQVIISDFGTGPSATGTWTYNNGAFTGSSNSGDSLVQIALPSIDITGQTELRLTLSGSVTGITGFTVTLRDSANSTVSTTSYNTGQLNSGTAISALNFGAGDVTDVTTWQLQALGNPGDSFSLNLSQMDAIPEPSTALLIGLAGLGFLARRRRC